MIIGQKHGRTSNHLNLKGFTTSNNQMAMLPTEKYGGISSSGLLVVSLLPLSAIGSAPGWIVFYSPPLIYNVQPYPSGLLPLLCRTSFHTYRKVLLTPSDSCHQCTTSKRTEDMATPANLSPLH
jgi:hypothetical protein